jgi:hypothetical protein
MLPSGLPVTKRYKNLYNPVSLSRKLDYLPEGSIRAQVSCNLSRESRKRARL